MTQAKRYWLSGEFNKVAPPPPAPKDNTVDIYHGTKVADPFRPLEQLDAEPTAQWVAAQNARFQQFIDGSPSLPKVKSFLQRAMDYPKESMPGRYGPKTFFYAKTGLAAQYDYFVRDTADGPARMLINANQMSKDGTVSLSGVYPSPDGKLVAYTVSDAGSDAITMKIRDVESGEDLPDTIPDLRFTGATWDQGSSAGLNYYAPAKDDLRRFISMHHTVGDAAADDQAIFGIEEEDAFAATFFVRDSKALWASVGIGTLPSNGLWVRPEGEKDFKKIFDHSIASYSPVAEINGKIYMVTDYEAPLRKLVAFDPANPDPKSWETVIPEHPTDPLHWVKRHQDILLVEHGHDTADHLAVYDLAGKHLHDAPTPLQSTLAFARMNRNDQTLLVNIANFQQPGALYNYDFKNNTLDLVKLSTATETLTDCIIERIHAVSKDGTKVPMTVIRHPDTKLDGTAAAKLYGYGGFNVPLNPDYETGIAQWVRAGGIYVQSNLRGGGEFGSEWYDQGRRHNKQNVFDDFAACAEKLIGDKYTTPKRLVIEGGSNGGLLTLATMLQRPELFGAVISDVPVTDMYRFDKHTHGAAWRSDYGDSSASRDDFETASRYSPLHNVKRKIYPPTLLNTGDHDDRVVPSHAYKFVATMQEKAHPNSVCLLRVETRAGHGAGKPTDKVIQEMADTHAFVERAIGPVNQNDYKAERALLKASGAKPSFS